MIRFVAAIALFGAMMTADAALAGPELKFPAITGIAVHGGAHVVLRHGNVQRVSLIQGDLAKADLHMSGTTLDISPCKNWCYNVGKFEIEIVSPKIDNIEAHGGGALDAAGDFPRQPVLSIQAHGGGAVDVRAIPVDNVKAQAHGGGAIRIKALSSIDAQAYGGGAITFTGNPPHIASQIHGGGAISKE